jgi:hypothetical protein
MVNGNKHDEGNIGEYKGTGRIVGALGRASIEAGAGTLIGGVVGIGVGAVLKNSRAGMQVGAMIGSTAGQIDGAVRGWKDASAGKEQYKEIKTHVERLKESDALREAVADAGKGRF